MDIIGIDNPCMDLSIVCPHIPKEGELVPMKEMSLQGGGKVPNALIAAARLGGKVGIIGVVGDDRNGRICVEDFQAHNVDTSHLVMDSGKTAYCLSLIDTNSHGKHYIEYPKTHRSLAAEELDYKYIAEARFLLIYQFDEVAVAAAKFAKNNGIKVIVDADEFDARTQENIGLTDIFIASEYYYSSLFSGGDFKTNLSRLSEMGPNVSVVTLGEEGSVGIENGKFFRVKSYPVAVYDTTGAGDVFHGAFCYCMSRNMQACDAAEFSGAVSAIKCTCLGGRAGIPTEPMVRSFMSTGRFDRSELELRDLAYREAAWK